jgi:hypothetical protein
MLELLPVRIESTTNERRFVTIETHSDPSTTFPKFTLTTNALGPTGWVSGDWVSPYSAAGLITARTPRFGEAGQLILVQGKVVELFMTWHLGPDEDPVRVVEVLDVY